MPGGVGTILIGRKLAGEHLCTLYADNFGVPTVSLRYFTVYGPGQRPDMAFARWIDAAFDALGLWLPWLDAPGSTREHFFCTPGDVAPFAGTGAR